MYHVKKLSKGSGRRIAVGDIHGHFCTFKALVEDKVKLTKNDQLFLLGDLIGRGDNGSLVLDYSIKLKAEGFQIYPIKGNHEEKLLMSYGCGFEFFESYLDAYNMLDLLDGDLNQYLSYISQFDYCIAFDDIFLSHSGINEDNQSPSTDIRGMFPNVDFSHIDWEILSQKRQVHGHTTISFSQLKNAIHNNHRKISIDVGCTSSTDSAWLIALDLDSMELYQQKCLG